MSREYVTPGGLVSDAGDRNFGLPGGYIGVTPAAAGGGGNRAKVWSGSAWVQKPAKVWSGSAWVTKPVKIWNGSAWV
jgi:hypothetical protein